jgi:hypothetical protein
MLWEAILMGANEDLDSIPKQFISVIELLEIFASCENMTHERAARWFINNIQILNRTKKLILKMNTRLLNMSKMIMIFMAARLIHSDLSQMVGITTLLMTVSVLPENAYW